MAIKIPREEYDELIQTARDFGLLRRGLLDAAVDINYTGKELSFSADKLNNVVSLIFPRDYSLKIKAFKSEKAEENE